MQTITYVGRYPAVVIETAPKRHRTVKRGESIDVPDGRAESLLEQTDNWAKKAPAKKPAAKPDTEESTDG